MANGTEVAVWGIHAGIDGVAHDLFVKKGCVALGWSDLHDLSKVAVDREKLKAEITKYYPKLKQGAVPGIAGQLFRFINEMNVRDFIVYPSKRDRQINIGKIDGPYHYQPDFTYPNTRPVSWLKALPRTHFSQGALYEIGSAMSFFQVKTYADEFLAVLENRTALQPVVKDETVSLISEDVEQTTQDFILKKLSQELKGHPLSDFIAHLLGTMGYRTRVSPEGPDGGVDIIAYKDSLGLEPPIIKVQVKSGDGSVGDPVVSALCGKVAANEYGLLVTLGTFTSKAIEFAKSKNNLRLIDANDLIELILEHYEQFDSRYKGLLPLKRVYIPESIKLAEDSE